MSLLVFVLSISLLSLSFCLILFIPLSLTFSPTISLSLSLSPPPPRRFPPSLLRRGIRKALCRQAHSLFHEIPPDGRCARYDEQ